MFFNTQHAHNILKTCVTFQAVNNYKTILYLYSLNSRMLQKYIQKIYFIFNKPLNCPDIQVVMSSLLLQYSFCTQFVSKHITGTGMENLYKYVMFYINSFKFI